MIHFAARRIKKGLKKDKKRISKIEEKSGEDKKRIKKDIQVKGKRIKKG